MPDRPTAAPTRDPPTDEAFYVRSTRASFKIERRSNDDLQGPTHSLFTRFRDFYFFPGPGNVLCVTRRGLGREEGRKGNIYSGPAPGG